jgi:ribosomal protein S18 acetylase RimI-like enzyme
MSFAMQDLKIRKIDRIYLEVAVSNTVAVKFYQSFDFEILVTKKKFYSNGQDAFAMQRIL